VQAYIGQGNLPKAYIIPVLAQPCWALQGLSGLTIDGDRQ
jgi:hypothetical protein